MKSWLLLSLIGLMIAGCGSQQAVRKRDDDASSPRGGVIVEDFDPSTLNEQELKIKSVKTVEAKSDYDESFLAGIGNDDVADQKIDGYRVQICAVSVEDTARSIQQDAILKFNENVYLRFDSPYYKVRIGDCKTRYEAERLQRLAIQKGFNEAWVVKTTVQPVSKSEQEKINNAPQQAKPE